MRFTNLFGLFFMLLFDHLNFVNLLKSSYSGDTSLLERVKLWTQIYSIWNSTYMGKLFGIGWTPLYMESFVLRVLFSFGILGCISIVYLAKNLKLYFAVYILLAGLTLDLLLSQKIFIFICLYIMSTNKLRFTNNVK